MFEFWPSIGVWLRLKFFFDQPGVNPERIIQGNPDKIRSKVACSFSDFSAGILGILEFNFFSSYRLIPLISLGMGPAVFALLFMGQSSRGHFGCSSSNGFGLLCLDFKLQFS
jgi:hypothetical protein